MKQVGYIFLNNMPLLLKAAIRRFKRKRDWVCQGLAYRNKTIEKLNVHIRIGLAEKKPKQFEIGELLINNGGLCRNCYRQRAADYHERRIV
jgi:hypothetical protein